MESHSSKDIVMSYQRALGNQDYKTARSYLRDDLSFRGPLASHDTPEPLLKDLEQTASHREGGGYEEGFRRRR